MSKQPFIPHDLPIANLDWKRLIAPIGHASIALGRYDGILTNLHNPAILLSPLTTNEAVLSSRIEGTQATLDEVLKNDAGLVYDEAKTNDIGEIRNYRKALIVGEQELEHRHLSLNLLKSLHAILLDTVRGKDKKPGVFRLDQNWIGSLNCPMELATYVPPNPIILQERLEKWQEYIEKTDEDPLVQLAVAHAQFEILHPFNDGNGRIGRMLIPLLLFQKGILSRPMFYLSEYLEAHRREYYNRLLAISDQDDWQGWIEFFLTALTVQSRSNSDKAHEILSLYNEMKNRFTEVTRSQFAIRALDAFFLTPVMSSTDFIRLSDIKHRATAHTILKQLREAKCITVMREGSGQQPAIYVMPRLVNIAEGRNVLQTTN